MQYNKSQRTWKVFFIGQAQECHTLRFAWHILEAIYNSKSHAVSFDNQEILNEKQLVCQCESVRLLRENMGRQTTCASVYIF